MPRYQHIAYAQGHDAQSLLTVLDEEDATAALHDLLKIARSRRPIRNAAPWDQGDAPERGETARGCLTALQGQEDTLVVFDSSQHDNLDATTETIGAYVMFYNRRRGYVGVCRVVE